MNRTVMILATWFWSGNAPFASGTFGTLAAIPLYLLMSYLSFFQYISASAVFIIISFAVAQKAGEILGEHDSGRIVIDEVAGFLVTMTGISLSSVHVAAGFLLFRLFDIIKPFPAGWIDRNVRNGTGVVLDDVAAGIYACFSLHILSRYF